MVEVDLPGPGTAVRSGFSSGAELDIPIAASAPSPSGCRVCVGTGMIITALPPETASGAFPPCPQCGGCGLLKA